jgi:antirestriction protein
MENIYETSKKNYDMPAIYIADLADYNAGILTGDWIQLYDGITIDEVYDRINDILKSGVDEDSFHEEWAIHDYENLPSMGEYPNLEEVLEVAKAVHEYGYDVTKALVNYYDVDIINELGERFLGIYNSLEDYAYEFVNDCYNLEKLMGNLSHYFDYEKFARDLDYSGDIVHAKIDSGKVVVFSNY